MIKRRILVSALLITLAQLTTLTTSLAQAPAVGLGAAPATGGGTPGSVGATFSNASPVAPSGSTATNITTGNAPIFGAGADAKATAAEASSRRSSGEAAANYVATRDVSSSPNEFQRFVSESTGRMLPLFGYNLFARSSFGSLQNVPVPSDYVLGPGDEIAIRLWGSVDGDFRTTVDRNGMVHIPKVGSVGLAGTKVSQLEATLRTHISRVYNNFQFSATLGQLRSIQIFIVGQARQPGAYTVSSLSTLISALFESGGPSANGSMRNIQVRRDGQLITQIDLYQFISKGDKHADIHLLPGDVIVIPPAGPRVALLGTSDNPAIYELAKPEESLEQLLSYGGGTLSLTSPHKVMLERINKQQSKAPRAVENRTLNPEGLRSTVRDGDVITLFKISPEYSNAVTLRGNVAAPLRYVFQPGMRISDLIPEQDALILPDYYVRKNLMVQFESGKGISGERVASEVRNLLEEINWDFATIERLDPGELRTQLITFNLGRAIKNRDVAHNHVLQPGDVVTVFGINDIPVPLQKRTQYVRLGGEVLIPGVYQITPGETLPQLLVRAGGFAANAFPYGTVFTRESSRAQQQANLNQAIRRLESEINSMAATLLQNLSDDKGASVQAQIAGQRILLSRLQSLKASGRISLEMRPDSNTLPPIVLEDGDQIVVPHRPSFVGVFGAVMAENSFIYRSDYSVRDYLRKAGMSREADEDAILIIRADGSVESNPAQRSWFSASSRFMEKTLNPGDSVFVPEQIDRRSGYNQFVQGAKDWTTILYQLGLGAVGLKTLRQ